MARASKARTTGCVLAACGVAAVVAAMASWVLPSKGGKHRAASVASIVSSASRQPPGLLQDPVSPGRPVALDQRPRALVGDWVSARPAFQYSRSTDERGGIEPCATQAVDSTSFGDWVQLKQGRFSAPRDLRFDAAGNFDLVIHLNGDEPIRRELIKSQQPFVLYTLTLAPNEGYAPLFSGAYLFDAILAGVEQAISKKTGRAARVGHVAMSAWSAGFVGIAAALAQSKIRQIDAVLLIDGLHAPRNDELAFKAQLQPFVDYAARAASGERFMFVTHSSIDPPSFASTTECAHYLVASLSARPLAVRREDVWGLELVEYFSRGDFHVRGYAGNDKPDHCAQLALLRDAFAALGRRWSGTSTPASPTNGRASAVP
jgi:hypothetical protein